MPKDHAPTTRILIIDDNPSIHSDFRKVLSRQGCNPSLAQSEIVLFGDTVDTSARPDFQIDCATQGEAGLTLLRQALAEEKPYAVAFVDVRMPPGIDGIATTRGIWALDPDIQVVLCTAFSDHSWEQIRGQLGRSDRLVILKKPFDNIEVQQLADTLGERWKRARRTNRRLKVLDKLLVQRARAHEVARLQEQQEALNTIVRRRRMLDGDLRQAMQAEQLCLHYQPLVDVASRRVVGMEALVRWQHPHLGEISPTEFIPLAEQSGLILPLGEFVLRTACAQVMRWQREGAPVVPVAVNISAIQLQDRRLPQLVREVLRSTGLPARLLMLELTESVMMHGLQNHLTELQGLRDEGIRIELDDFGTGYSSLSYLQHLPVDTLKIDRSFIKNVDTQAADAAIVAAILHLAHALGVNVVAEGVETAAQLDVLRRHGCETAQGFFFSRPLPAEQCRELLHDLSRRPAFTDTLRIRLAAGARHPAGILGKVRI